MTKGIWRSRTFRRRRWLDRTMSARELLALAVALSAAVFALTWWLPS